jgi:hypothetical protein
MVRTRTEGNATEPTCSVRLNVCDGWVVVGLKRSPGLRSRWPVGRRSYIGSLSGVIRSGDIYKRGRETFVIVRKPKQLPANLAGRLVPRDAAEIIGAFAVTSGGIKLIAHSPNLRLRRVSH